MTFIILRVCLLQVICRKQTRQFYSLRFRLYSLLTYLHFIWNRNCAARLLAANCTKNWIFVTAWNPVRYKVGAKIDWSKFICSGCKMQKKHEYTRPNQSCKSGRAFRVGLGFGPGSGSSVSKCFGPILGLHTKLFYNIQSKDFFFCDLHWLYSPRWFLWVKWLWFFLQLIIFANTAGFFCSLLGLVSHSHSFPEVDNGNEISKPWHCFEEINHLRNSWLVLRNDDLQAGFSGLWGLS